MSSYGSAAATSDASPAASSASASPRADDGSGRDAAASSDGAGVPGWVWPVGVLLVVVALVLSPPGGGGDDGRRPGCPASGRDGRATGSDDGTDEQDSGTRGSRRVAAHDTTKEV